MIDVRERDTSSLRKHAYVRPAVGPHIVSVGTATPPRCYTQDEVLDIFQESDPRLRRLFRNSHIKYRYLYLPEGDNGAAPEENNQALIDKHLRGALEIGPQAIEECLKPVGLAPHDVDMLCCMSSTGFLCPGLSAHLIKKLGFRENVRRVDISGMGCNAAMNGLQTISAFSKSHPGKLALLLCIEICSAAYVYNRNMSTAVVNSLFGDGAAAVLMCTEQASSSLRGPIIEDFEPQIVSEALDAMKYNLEDTKLSFYLDRDIPYVIGKNVEKPINRLLGRHGLKRRDIDHWIVHAGGKKVIDAIEYNLGLSDRDMRHTLSVLRNYGNLSSGSILFSYKELCGEQSVREGDLGVAIAMGPGTSIETALLVW